MKKFTGHTEPWGSFVDVKINAEKLLREQLARADRGAVMVSSVTDPYQPIEARYTVTRRCLEVLREYQFPVDILTKSPLVRRDMDIFTQFEDIEVGITITTDNEKIRTIFEPYAPSIRARINALKALQEKGITTYAFIGPVLPMNPETLSEKIRPHVNRILIDRMNYTSKTQRTYSRIQMTEWIGHDFVDHIIERLKKGFSGKEVCIC